MNEDRSRIHRVDGSAIDEAIDRAVRDIMSAEPPAGLRRRVLARLDAPRRPSLLPRLAFAAAAVAAIALAVVLLRPSPQLPAVSRQTVARDVRLTPEPTTRLSPAPASAVPSAAQTARGAEPASTRIPMPRITNVFGERGARVAAATAAVDDVVFPAGEVSPAPGAAQPGGIPLSEITIVPLQVEQIRIAPLVVRR